MLRLSNAVFFWTVIFPCIMWSNINVWWAPDYYRSPTMLWEGNVFTDVCVSICSQGAGSLCDHYPWYIGHHCKSPPIPWTSDLGPPPPTSDLDPQPPPSDIWWLSLKTCSNLFIWEHPGSTSGGGHWSMYSLQAGGTHPPGILSCVRAET